MKFQVGDRVQIVNSIHEFALFKPGTLLNEKSKAIDHGHWIVQLDPHQDLNDGHRKWCVNESNLRPWIEPTTTESLVQSREAIYGNFQDGALLSQDLRKRIRTTPQWSELKADQREALEMIVHKISRILNGNPNYVDSWVDIAGYATLVVERLRQHEEGGAT